MVLRIRRVTISECDLEEKGKGLTLMEGYTSLTLTIVVHRIISLSIPWPFDHLTVMMIDVKNQLTSINSSTHT